MRIGVTILLALAGCATTRLGNLSLASTRPLPVRHTVLARGVEGRDCDVANNAFTKFMFGWAVDTTTPSAQTALDRALEQVPGADALTNVSVRTKLQFAGYLVFNSECIYVRGDAVRVESSAGEHG